MSAARVERIMWYMRTGRAVRLPLKQRFAYAREAVNSLTACGIQYASSGDSLVVVHRDDRGHVTIYDCQLVRSGDPVSVGPDSPPPEDLCERILLGLCKQAREEAAKAADGIGVALTVEGQTLLLADCDRGEVVTVEHGQIRHQWQLDEIPPCGQCGAREFE